MKSFMITIFIVLVFNVRSMMKDNLALLGITKSSARFKGS